MYIHERHADVISIQINGRASHGDEIVFWRFLYHNETGKSGNEVYNVTVANLSSVPAFSESYLFDIRIWQHEFFTYHSNEFMIRGNEAT